LKLPPRPSQPAASGSGTGRAGPATPQGPGQPANGQSHNGQPHSGQPAGASGQPPVPQPHVAYSPAGLLVIETTLQGVRSVRWLVNDPRWLAGEGVTAGFSLDQAPALLPDRAAAEAAAAKLGIVLPSEPELHAMMWG
ncbi:MAG: hypothetical protein ACRDT6_18960, partial [Micromonosporaceae bacterium]